MAVRYCFREDGIFALPNASKADPQVIGEVLDQIATKGGGELTPGAVVDAARAPRHALHPFFEWNDQTAAQRFRLDQARSLIRSIHAIDADVDAGSAQAFISVSDRSGTSYRRLSDVKQDADLQHAVLTQAERDLLAFETRYKNLLDVCDLVRRARERLIEERNKRGAAKEIRPS